MASINSSAHLHGELSVSYCRKLVFTIVALAIFILSIYCNSFDCSWHFDDEQNITDNPNLHLSELSWKNIRGALFSDRNHPKILYRPMACLSFALNHYVNGLEVFGYHLVNIFIHFLAAIFLFLFIYHTLNLPLIRERYSHNAYFIALLSTLLWAINPIQIQAITYIVQRMTSLAGMFYIMSMYFYLKARTTETNYKKIFFFLFCSLSFLMALGSKENAIMLPLSIFLFDSFLLQENFKDHMKKNMRILLIAALGILLLGFAYFYFKKGNMFSFLDGYQNRPFTLGQRLLTEPRIMIFYISLLLYPVPTRLNIAHDITLSNSLFDPLSTIISICLILGVIILALYLVRKWPLIIFCILFFFLNHVIESTVLPLELAFEHRNYIPSMLFFVPVAIGFCYLFNYYDTQRPMRYILFSFIVLFLVGLGHSTFMRNFTWKNEKSLWIDASQKAPDLYRPHHNLGRYYDIRGYIEEAISEYRKALEKPVCNRKNEVFVTHYNLGRIYTHLKDHKRALSFYHRALVLNPDHAPSYNNISSIMDRQGRYELSYNYLVKAFKLDPQNAEINYNLGLHFLREGQADRAVLHLNKSVEKRALRDRVFLYLGMGYKQKGQLGRAVICFRNALKKDPGNIRTHLHLAETFYRAGHYERAKREIEHSVDLIKGKETFYEILQDLIKKDQSSRLRPSANILIPLMRDACLDKSETLKEWGELLHEEDLRLKGSKQEMNSMTGMICPSLIPVN